MELVVVLMIRVGATRCRCLFHISLCLDSDGGAIMAELKDRDVFFCVLI